VSRAGRRGFGLKRFRQYILGRKVLVRSDHAALSYLRRTKDTVAQQARWLDFIEQFDITVRHRSGSAHRAGDVLSRRPREGAGPCNQCNKRAGAVVVESALQYDNWGDAVVVEPRCAGVVTMGQAPRCAQDAEIVATSHPSLMVSHKESAHQQDGGVPSTPDAGGEIGDPPTAGEEGAGWTTNELEELQQKDPNTGPLRLWLEAGVRPPREFLDCDSSELKGYWAQFDSFVLVEGIVYRRFERPDGTNQYLQLLIPRCLRQHFLGNLRAQATGHFA